jgi:DNA-binding transcriptional regulator GbsR (MarR family)
LLTRRELTQEQLQELTGYSAGTISNALNQLLVVNIVNCRTIPGSRKKLYQIVQPLEMMGAVAPLMKDYLKRRRRFLKRITRVTEQITQKYDQIIAHGGGNQLNLEIGEKIQKFQHFIVNFEYTIPIMEQVSKIFAEEFGKLGTE